MRFKELYGENIYSYERLNITEEQFNCGGLTAVIGRNIDQDTDNGSGKSSILKVIYYLLYGTELNGVSVELISNRVIDRGHFGEIVFEDRGREFRIQRFRDFRPSKNSRLILPEGTKAKQTGVKFFIDGEPFGDKKENGEERSITELNKIILNRIGISPELFLASVMTAQDSNSNFLEATDTRKKELISEMLNLEVYETAYDAVKKDIDATQAQIDTAETRLVDINKELEEKEKEIIKLQNEDQNFQNSLNKELSEVKKRFDAAEAQYVRIQGEKPSIIDPAPVEEKIRLKKEEIASLSSSTAVESGELKIIQIQITETEGIIRLIEGDMSRINGQLQSAESVLKKGRTLEAVETELNGLLKEKQSLTSINETIFKETTLLNLEKLMGEARTKSLNLERTGAKTEAALTAVKEKVKELTAAENCPTCNQPWDEEHKKERDEKVKALIEKENTLSAEFAAIASELAVDLSKQLTLQIKIVNLNSEIEKIKESSIEVEALKAQYEGFAKKVAKIRIVAKNLEEKKEVELEKAREAVKADQEKLSVLNDEIQKLTTDLALARSSAKEYKTWEDSFNLAARSLQEVAHTAKQVKTRVNPYKDLVANAQARIDELNERKQNNKERIEKLEEELKYLNFWKSGFGPTGIRSFISDEIVIHLNEIVREYLNDLFDGAISVVFESESINQKGGVSNKISTKSFLNGKETPVQLLSGGERQRVVLAVDLALSDIAESRTGTKINLKFMDEPFNGIDSNGQLKSIALFSKIANRKNGFFIISHDKNFQALCQNTIFVIKKDEISKVVGQEEFRKLT